MVCTVCTVLLKTKPSPASNYLYISSLSFCRPNACTTKQINIRATHIQKIDHCTLIPLQRRHNPQIILLICTFRLELKFTHVSFFLMRFVPHSIIYYEQNVFELSILLGLNFKTIKFNNPLFERSKSFDEISSWQELYSILSKRKELYSKSIHNWISKWIVPIVEIPSRRW